MSCNCKKTIRQEPKVITTPPPPVKPEEEKKDN
jgi:hypothetical protein